MFLSTPAKIFHATCFLSIVFAGCSLWRSTGNSASAPPPEPKSDYPFDAREPQVFQAEIVVRTGESERRTFVARDGYKRRMDFDVGTDNQRAVLITDKEYLLYFKRKVFEEHELSSNLAEYYEPLTAEMLSMRDYVSFKEIRRTGSVVEFTAHVNESVNSEVQIVFDESIGLPVKQEFYSIEGDQRKLQYSVELMNFDTSVDEGTFQIPVGFKRGTQSRTR